MKPKRVQLSRAAGWKMPENTIKVDRTTKWGNPFVMGQQRTRAECVDLFRKLCCGYICLTRGDPEEQRRYLNTLRADLPELAGKNLACWCPKGEPCHADVLLELSKRFGKKML